MSKTVIERGAPRAAKARMLAAASAGALLTLLAPTGEVRAGVYSAAPGPYQYVGSWVVGAGPEWGANPAVYSAQEAAALLFGGAAGDYAISTISSDPTQINYLAFYDGWGDGQYLTNPQAQYFRVDLGAPGYNDPGGYATAYSAYVRDHSDASSNFRNYAFYLPGNLCPGSMGDDVCALDAGSYVVGVTDAGAGIDVLQLGGSADFGFDADTIGATFLNFESLRKTGASTVTLTGSAELPVYVDAGTLIVDGDVTNAGGAGITIDGAGATVEVLAGAHVGGAPASQPGIRVTASHATVVNAGTVDGFFGVYFDASGTLTNQAGGLIEGVDNTVQAGGDLALTNAGTIRTGGSSPTVWIGGAGTVTNQAGGLIEGVTNTVNIQGLGTLTNAGTIRSGAGGADYPTVYMGAGGTVTNQAGGVIEGPEATAVYVVGTAGSVDNAGMITGGWRGYGVYLAAGGAVTNSGSIVGGGRSGVRIRGGAGGVTNSGTIGGVDYGVLLNDGGAVDNLAGGVIEGADGVRADAALILANAGAITGATGWGVVGSADADDVQTSGAIGGAAGALALGAGDDRLTLVAGATLDGVADGGDDLDALILSGTGEATLDLGQFVNFESQAKEGEGTWILTGTAVGDVGWTVTAGTLVASGGAAIGDGATVDVAADATFALIDDETVGALAGTGTVDLGGSTLTLGAASDLAFGGSIAGDAEGSLVKTGAGALTLSGASTFSGYAVVQQGTLRLGGDERLSDLVTVQVAAGATLDLQGYDETVRSLLLNGVLAGTGALTAGEYLLDGATVEADLGGGELYAVGGVSVLSGTVGAEIVGVAAGTLQLAGDERLWDGALVQIDEGALLDLAGWEETIGALWGEGELALGGGDLTVGYGDGDFAFGGVVSGSGSLTKTGDGVFTLLGEQTFTGALNVAAGELAFGGSTAGPLVVDGGRLTGLGEVGGLLRLTSGSISPGLDGGAGLGLIQAGSLAVSGGTLTFGFAGADQGYLNDHIAVVGGVTLTGGVIDARPVSALSEYGFNQQYLLISGSGVSGQFANLQDFAPNAYESRLLQRLRYDLVPGAVVLEVRRMVDWSEGAETELQSLIGDVLENTQLDGDDQWAEILGVLIELTPEERMAAFEDMSGEGLANVSTSAVQFGDRFQGVMQGRMGAAGAGGGGGTGGAAFTALPFGQGARPDVMAGALALAEPAARGEAGAWMEAFVVDSELKGRDGAADTGAEGGGFASGFDVQAGPGWRLGVAAGYSDMEADTSDRSTASTGQFWHVGAYAGYESGPWYAGAAVSRLSGDVDIARQIGIGPLTVDVAGRTEVDALNVSAGFGRRFRLGETTELRAGFTGTGSQVRQDAYTETGAGGLSLNVAEIERTLWVGEVGGRLTRELNGGRFTPYVGAGAAFAVGDLDSLANVGFTGAPTGSGTFLVGGAELPPNWAKLEAGFAFRPRERVAVSLSYDAALAERLEEHRAGVKVSVRW